MATTTTIARLFTKTDEQVHEATLPAGTEHAPDVLTWQKRTFTLAQDKGTDAAGVRTLHYREQLAVKL